MRREGWITREGLIEALDCCPTFEDDDEAIGFVYRRALHRSKPHVEAIVSHREVRPEDIVVQAQDELGIHEIEVAYAVIALRDIEVMASAVAEMRHYLREKIYALNLA